MTMREYAVPLLLLVFPSVASAQQTISTVAGGGPNNLPALASNIPFPISTVEDSSGNLYVSVLEANRIYKITPSGQLSIVAGNGNPRFSGDGGPATNAEISQPWGLAVDRIGNLFIADSNNRVREVIASTGVIQTVAGNGQIGFSGDGGPATNAAVEGPTGLAVDTQGNIFVATRNRVREIVASTGIIQTVAGNGQIGLSGDGGPATSAALNSPTGVCVDRFGNIFISDTGNEDVREVDASTGKIRTVAGSLPAGFSGDGGPAIAAQLFTPRAVTVDSSGNIFIADTNNNRIREVVASTGIIQTVAGNGTLGLAGDGGPATMAQLNSPSGVFLNALGNIVIADSGNNLLREVVASTGNIQTIVGNSTVSYSGDGFLATDASLSFQVFTTGAFFGGTFVDSSGNLFIADSGNHRIREVVASTGIIQTVAGNGQGGFSGDGGPATSAELRFPLGVFVDSGGNIFIADTGNGRIREVVKATGNIQTVAGNGPQFNVPYGVFVDESGNILVADPGNNAIEELVASTGNIQSIMSANSPTAVVEDKLGNIFVAENGNNRIREILATTGAIVTVAGNGSPGFSGDGLPAIGAQLWQPSGIAVDDSGNLFIADFGNNRIREVVASTGNIHTVAGEGTNDFSGDEGPATDAALNQPAGVVLDKSGNLFIADAGNYRIREVLGPILVPDAVLSSTSATFTPDVIVGLNATIPITLTNAGTSALAISSFALSGQNSSDFSETNTCGSTVAAGANCMISITFKPVEVGQLQATLSITDSAGSSPQAITLSGAGIDFSLAPSGPNSVTVSAGQSAGYSIQLSAIGGLTSSDQLSVSVSCSGAPIRATCNTPASAISVTPSTPTTFAVNVATMANSALMPPQRPQRITFPFAVLVVLALFLFAMWPLQRAQFSQLLGRRPRAWLAFSTSVGLAALAAAFLTSCGGGPSSTPSNGTPPGTYTLTVSATTSGVSRTTQITLIVQ